MIEFLFLISFAINCQQKISDVALSYVNEISSITSKVALLYFESTDGIPRDGIIFTEKLLESMVKYNKIKIIDPMMVGAKLKSMNVKNLADLNYESTVNLTKEIGSSYIIIGSVSRISNTVETRGRIVKLPELEVVKVLSFKIYPEWDSDKTKVFPLMKYEEIDNKEKVKPTENCPYSELVSIALKNEESKYSYSCASFKCDMVDCSKYPTARKSIYKIYFSDPRKTVITTDDSFNILEKYTTYEH